MLKDMQIFQKTYELLLWLYPTVRRFPRGDRYVLGERIESCALNVLEGIIESNNALDKTVSLKKTSVELEKLRIFIRLAKDEKLISFRQYEFASERINEIGKMLGGLIRKFAGGPA